MGELSATLKSKVAGVPVIVWAAVGTLGVFLYLKHRQATTAASSSAAAAGPDTAVNGSTVSMPFTSAGSAGGGAPIINVSVANPPQPRPAYGGPRAEPRPLIMVGPATGETVAHWWSSATPAQRAAYAAAPTSPRIVRTAQPSPAEAAAARKAILEARNRRRTLAGR